MRESDYPYVAYKSTCKLNSTLGVVKTKGYVAVTKNSPSAHMTAVS